MHEHEHTPGAPRAGDTHDGGDGVPPGAVATDEVREEGIAAAYGAEQSRLLRALPLDEYAHLLPRLVPTRLRFKDVLVEPDAPIREVYFPRTGVVSVIADQQEGGAVEVSTVGPEGVVGLPVMLGGDTMPYRCIVQVEGDAWRLPADEFRVLVDDRRAVRRPMLRYAQYALDQVSQSVACNRLHTLEERCARWLLMMHDRVPGDAFEITHEFLAQMLGVRRAGVTVAMGTLQAEGVVRYMRGRVAVLDRRRLEEASCGCYAITRAAFDRLFG
jgi:CRP-like cAMP-binding protein